ncbi:uncharacterized protein [Atheta coriaria]|uniref:uncharacterized protein n=1 Tax=Dalotia coriaria TaxID=877792 RepID=UPI0031F3CF63
MAFYKFCTSFLGVFVLIKTISAVEFDNLSEEAQFDERHYQAFKHFGDKVKLLDTLQQKQVPLSLTLNANLENSFEHNLVLPKPQDYTQFASLESSLPSLSSHQGVRYTSTPVETYQVTEEVYEPKPIPQVVPVPGKPPLILGSGSLGIVNLGKGKYALGSGSLGYSQPVAHQQLNNKQEAGGGLHVVPPPQLGSSEAFDAAFNNFNFKPLHNFFGHN